MKKILLIILSWLVSTLAYCQTKVEVSFDKTTYMIFDKVVDHVDVGSNEVAFKVEGSMLKLKADVENFYETNMLINVNGKTMMFLLAYNNDPEKLLYEFTIEPNEPKEVKTILSPEETKIQAIIANRNFELRDLLDEKPSIIESDFQQGISVAIDNIFVDENSLYFRFHFENQSNIAFDIEDIQGMVKNDRKAKSTSLKSIYRNIEIIDTYNMNNSTIRATTSNNYVIQIEKITLAEKEDLIWVIKENQGQRNFNLKIKPKKLIKAIKL